MKVLSGNKLAGGNPKNERVKYDYYATNPLAVEMLLDNYQFKGETFLEPCIGEGNITNVIKDKYKHFTEFTGVDIIDRGYPDTIISDFLTWQPNRKYDCIISNPPFSLAKEFVEKGIELLTDEGEMAMFLKIQFLEGKKREEFFKQYPPKYIYVFRSRMATWNNGNPVDPNTGKKWCTTMCHAFFIWEKGSKTEPIVRWL